MVLPIRRGTTAGGGEMGRPNRRAEALMLLACGPVAGCTTLDTQGFGAQGRFGPGAPFSGGSRFNESLAPEPVPAGAGLGLSFHPTLTAIQIVDSTARYAVGSVSTLLNQPQFQQRFIHQWVNWRTVEAARLYARAGVEPGFGQRLAGSLGAYGSELGRRIERHATDIGLGALKDQPIGQEIDSQIRSLEQTWRQSPVGMWVDENRGTLIVAGSLLTAAGAGWMYSERKTMPSAASSAVNALLRSEQTRVNIGSFDVGLSHLTMRTRERIWGAALTVRSKLERVPGAFQAQFQARESRLESWSASGHTRIDLGRGFSVGANGAIGRKLGSGSGMDYQYALDVRRDVTNQPGRLAVSLQVTGAPGRGARWEGGVLTYSPDLRTSAGAYVTTVDDSGKPAVFFAGEYRF